MLYLESYPSVPNQVLVSPCGSLMSAHQAGSKWGPSSSGCVDSEEGCQSPSEGPLLYLLHTVHTSRSSESVIRLCENNASPATELVRAPTKGSEHQSHKIIWVYTWHREAARFFVLYVALV